MKFKKCVRIVTSVVVNVKPHLEHDTATNYAVTKMLHSDEDRSSEDSYSDLAAEEKRSS